MSLKNVFKEFRRDKSKKRLKASTIKATEKPRTPGRDIQLSVPTTPIGMFDVVQL